MPTWFNDLKDVCELLSYIVTIYRINSDRSLSKRI